MILCWNTSTLPISPSLDGQDFQFALKPFFELQVEAWRDNPQGAFVDWNKRANCSSESLAAVHPQRGREFPTTTLLLLASHRQLFLHPAWSFQFRLGS
jgi:hypothetical protein